MKHREVLIGFLDALKDGKVPDENVVTKTWLSKHDVDDLKAAVDLGVKEYTILKCNEISKALVTYIVTLRVRSGVVRVRLALVREMAPYRTSTIPLVGRWGVNPDSWAPFRK